MEDPDAPNGTFDHWIAWNIAPEKKIQENRALGTGGKNSFGKTGYGGPCPPSGTHRYYFKIYALNTSIDLLAGSDKKALLQAMEGHIMASGELMGKYARQ
jgi:Raf kinase inhibitor-like YbhB/YbcL family protein